ncbi:MULTISPECIES: hypothetical protein [Brevundimonas]|uniref:hypothetical protein n=1 Tax=Brevundimonas TaxID=41275 RepID=UPI00320A026F
MLLDSGVVPIAFLGTLEAKVLFERNLQLNGRLLPPCDLQPLDSKRAGDRDLFARFVDRLDHAIVEQGILAPDQVESGRRRVPPSHVPGAPDKAIWMVRDLGFCPTSWEMLIDCCPRPTCNLLTWMNATALHVCGYCRTPVSALKRRTVPRAYRPALSWVVGLFGDDAEQERSMKALMLAYSMRIAS